MPGPRFAGLVSDFLPVDRATVQRAVDRFLDTLDGVAGEITSFEPSSALMISAATISVGVLAVVVIKRRGRTEEQGKFGLDEARRVEMALLRTLPVSWNWDLAEQ
jgi:hypothetical protein